MRLGFYIGWLFLLVAFAAAAAETIARTLPGGSGWILSAAELWQALWPGAYLIALIRISGVMPELWDPVILTLLSIPAWLLLGFPGLILAWMCRPNRVLSPEAEQELQEHEASLFLYDDLAREARKWAQNEGDDRLVDDRLPNHDVVDLFERQPDDPDDYSGDGDLGHVGVSDDPDTLDEDPIKPLPEFVKPRGE
jgi:hypothetical protein